MPNLHKGKDCCGCSACFAVCPKDAISMKESPLGFKYPEVDAQKCIECRLCERVCAFKKDYATPDNFENPIPVGVRLKDKSELMKSRSGGVFKAITDYVLSNGGVIYGVAADNELNIVHQRASTPEERDEFRGSKYVQSDLRLTLRQILTDLKAGKLVVFSGTACQTSGVASYIPVPLHKNLILVDIVCHGVPAPAIWKDFTKYAEHKEGSKIKMVNFRDKKFGWHTQYETLTYENGKQESSQIFSFLFHKAIMMRPSCAVCHFTNLRRPSDLTLADFWGWEKTDPDFNKDDKGASLLLINTPKGKEIWENVKDECDYIFPRLEDCLQPNLQHPTTLNPLSERFEKDYASYGFKYVLNKYGNVGLHYKLRILSMKIANRIKRLIGMKVTYNPYS